jgi:hypothetical protein
VLPEASGANQGSLPILVADLVGPLGDHLLLGPFGHKWPRFILRHAPALSCCDDEQLRTGSHLSSKHFKELEFIREAKKNLYCSALP